MRLVAKEVRRLDEGKGYVIELPDPLTWFRVHADGRVEKVVCDKVSDDGLHSTTRREASQKEAKFAANAVIAFIKGTMG